MKATLTIAILALVPWMVKPQIGSIQFVAALTKVPR
jgi:hypothetical protein